jgi:hypothetical protein
MTNTPRSCDPPAHVARISTAKIAALAAIAIGLAVACPASGFDQNRRGFVLEYGLGPSYSTAIVHELDSQGSSVEAGQMQFLGATRFHIGVGVSERLAIMYVNDLAVSLDDRFLYRNAFTINSLSGIGARWYARDAAPSWHAEGALGLAHMSTPGGSSSSDIDSDSGFGFEGGVGYEFARGWSASFVARRLEFGENGFDRNAFDLVLSHVHY